MKDKDLENEIAKVMLDSNCVDKAIEHANSIKDGVPYLSFLAGAYYVIKYLKLKEK